MSAAEALDAYVNKSGAAWTTFMRYRNGGATEAEVGRANKAESDALAVLRLAIDEHLAFKRRDAWVTCDEGVNRVMHGDVTDARPLVVIDPEDAEAVERLARVYREQTHAELGPYPMSLPAYRMQAALREFASPPDPRPDEPLGLGAVVEDEEGRRWVRSADDECVNPWNRENGYDSREYAAISVVRVLSEGVLP